MRSISTVTAAATERALVSVDRLKRELAITGADDTPETDALLEESILAATAVIEGELERVLALQTYAQTFRPDAAEAACGPESLILAQRPVVAVDAVAIDGETVAAAEYEIDPETALLHRLDAAGNRSRWSAARAIAVTYRAGHALPDDCPAGLAAACADLARGRWFALGRDPLIKAESEDGVRSVDYWVGALAGRTPGLPDHVVRALDPHRDLGF